MIFTLDVQGLVMESPTGTLVQDFLDRSLIENDSKSQLQMILDSHGALSLCKKSHPQQKFTFDFIQILNTFKSQSGTSPGPLYRAIKMKRGERLPIIDATCGTGKDSLFFLFHGHQVTAFERHPIVYLLLFSALEIAKRDQDWGEIFCDKFQLIFGNPMEHTLLDPQIVYLDPMYPEKKKSSLSRKEMELFKELVGEDSDTLELLTWGRRVVKERVIVKRPPGAVPLMADLNFSLEGKAVRFDVYLPTV